MIAFVLISFAAAIVNGALGYGFSSIAAPLALLVVDNRMLTPSLVLLEVVLNAYGLYVNRAGLPRVWRRVAFVVVGLAPGVALGTAALTRVDPAWLKLATFTVFLPLLLLQAVGVRRAIRAERAASLALGGAVGALYAVTTISGPPLAMFLNNQGYARREFRAALGFIRSAECLFTAALYSHAGLFTPTSLSLLPYIIPGVVIGVPLGVLLIRRVREESFRRVCMTFDAAIVAFGASTLLRVLHVVDGSVAFLPFAGVIVFDLVVLYRFFRTPSPRVPTWAYAPK